MSAACPDSSPIPIFIISIEETFFWTCNSGTDRTHLGSNLALAQQLSHQSVFQVGISSTLGEMALGKEHVPKTQLLSLLLQLLDNSRCGGPSLLALAELGGEGSFGGDALLLDEFLDLSDQKN